MTLHQLKEIAESHGYDTRLTPSHVEIELPGVTRQGAHFIETVSVHDKQTLLSALGY